MRGSGRHGSGGLGGGPRFPGSWDCACCGMQRNFAERLTCRRCGEFRRRGAPTFGTFVQPVPPRQWPRRPAGDKPGGSGPKPKAKAHGGSEGATDGGDQGEIATLVKDIKLLEGVRGVENALEAKRKNLHELQDVKLEGKEPHEQIKEMDAKIAGKQKAVHKKEEEMERLRKELEEAGKALAQQQEDLVRFKGLREELIRKQSTGGQGDVHECAAKLLASLQALGVSVEPQVMAAIRRVKEHSQGWGKEAAQAAAPVAPAAATSAAAPTPAGPATATSAAAPTPAAAAQAPCGAVALAEAELQQAAAVPTEADEAARPREDSGSAAAKRRRVLEALRETGLENYEAAADACMQLG